MPLPCRPFLASATNPGVVVPNEHSNDNPDENGLRSAELAALNAFEQQFRVRRVLAYTWAGPNVVAAR